jgi:hypothetical protein
MDGAMSDFPDSLRMSALRTFITCPKRFELAVLNGERGEPKSERLRVGTALDRVVRSWAQWKRDEPATFGASRSPESGQAWLAEEYEKAGQEDDYAPTMPDEAHILPAAERILETVGKIIAKVSPCLVDARLSRGLTTASGTALEVTGTIDLTYKPEFWRAAPYVGDYPHHLRDVKMSGKGKEAWSAENAARDFQLRTYTWLADLDEETRVDTQGWIVGRALKRETQVLHESADVTDAAVIQTGENLTAIASAVEDACATGRFLPTAALEQHWSCQGAYCPLWERICPHGKRARTQVLIEGEAA